MITRPVLRYQGSKFQIADWVISHFPPHKRYCEPFGGTASVLMRKRRAIAECYNDLDQRVYTVFKVLQDRDKATELERRLRYTPFSRDEHKEAEQDQYCDDEIETARKTIVRSFMGNGANGATRTGKNGFGCRFQATHTLSNVDAWPNYPDQIQAFCDRLQGVVIENKDAIALIKQWDCAETLFYVDPPYVPGTWNNADKYKHAASDDYHCELLDTLKSIDGMAVLSGYDNLIYQKELADWQLFTKETINQKSEKRIECLWISPKAQAAIRNALPLLAEGGI